MRRVVQVSSTVDVRVNPNLGKRGVRVNVRVNVQGGFVFDKEKRASVRAFEVRLSGSNFLSCELG